MRLAQQALHWALSAPMFVKILGIGVLASTVFGVTTLLARQAAYGLALSILAAAALSGVLAHLVAMPLHQLRNAARRVGEGDFDVRAKPLCDDEIGQLAWAFNHMAQRLGEYRHQVEEKELARRLLLQQLVDTQEEERKHIARELHDQLGQSLMALLLWVQSECQAGGADSEFCRTLEEKIRQLADEIHRLAWGMRPSILDDYGLDQALARYLQELSEQSGVTIDYQSTAPPDSPRLPDRLEVALYRIVQEALTNVLRHAQATRASVVLLRQHGDVTLLVEDNGCGFNPAALARNGRLGLTGIRERAALFGGVCTVESEPDHGTTIRVRIPLGEESCLSVC
jgi:signal transduction histidine kinase